MPGLLHMSELLIICFDLLLESVQCLGGLFHL